MLFFFIIISLVIRIDADEINDILVFTVATENTDGFERYINSAKEFNIKPIVLGFGEKWKGGENIKTRPGGGWKINLLKNALLPYRDDKVKLVIFTDGYDVLFLSDLKQIVSQFKETGARVLFGAESYCWPDSELANKYPPVEDGYRFLNSGVYMGYISDIYKLITSKPLNDIDDDQLYFTMSYLDNDLRKSLNIKLDHKSKIFQNLNGASSDVELQTTKSLKTNEEKYYIKNVIFNTKPMILHGNGASKNFLNYLSNYVPNNWNLIDGCLQCKVNNINLEKRKPKYFPIVFLALFIEVNTPFIEEQFEKINNLNYPKNKIHLFIHNLQPYHDVHVKQFITEHGNEYSSIKEIDFDKGISESAARDQSLGECLANNCDYYFAVDSIAHLDNPYTLRLLIEQNRSVVAPLLTRPEKAWSNFWGALSKEGYYARSHDYMDIVFNEKRGLWIVPFITNSYLINATLFRKYDRSVLNFNSDVLDPDMAFCNNLRQLDVFMYVSNRLDFGHLVNPDTFDITKSEPEMYQIFDNAEDWNKRFIHPDYSKNLEPGTIQKQPCPDVYWFPVVTQRFCTSLINMMESFGKWSSGKNEDTRLESGYEAVPTRDIHMNQVDWERHWLYFLERYVSPLQEHVFVGYSHGPPRSIMNFVVRYRPDEQPSLRPHHDSSTYTINIALNQHNVDYEGGGCRFIRYNCSVVDTRPGWLLMHPGRLTHYHEGLVVTKGTRYIMIAFVDP